MKLTNISSPMLRGEPRKAAAVLFENVFKSILLSQTVARWRRNEFECRDTGPARKLGGGHRE